MWGPQTSQCSRLHTSQYACTRLRRRSMAAVELGHLGHCRRLAEARWMAGVLVFLWMAENLSQSRLRRCLRRCSSLRCPHLSSPSSINRHWFLRSNFQQSCCSLPHSGSGHRWKAVWMAQELALLWMVENLKKRRRHRRSFHMCSSRRRPRLSIPSSDNRHWSPGRNFTNHSYCSLRRTGSAHRWKTVWMAEELSLLWMAEELVLLWMTENLKKRRRQRRSYHMCSSRRYRRLSNPSSEHHHWFHRTDCSNHS